MTRRLWAASEFEVMPGCFPALLSTTHAERTLESMRKTVALYESVSSEDSAWWRKVHSRSPLLQMKVIQVTRMLQEQGWHVTEDVREVIRRDWSGVTQTKLIEDGIRTERVAETSKGFHKRVSDERTWLSLMEDDRSDHARHRFTPIPVQDQVLPRGIAGETSGKLFQ
eukprot:6486886-Amphidinium_carterae.1